MARISRVGDGWTVPERIDWYADLSAWLTAEASVNYGSRIEAVCKGNIGSNIASTTTAVPPHGWWAYADPSVYWKPNGDNWSTAPLGTRVYISTPSGLLSGLRFIDTNGFNSAFRFNATATKCIIEDSSIIHDHPTGASSGGEAFRVTTSTDVADRPIIRRCFIRQTAGAQPSIRQSTSGGHLLVQACVIVNPNNRYGIGNSSAGGTMQVYDSAGIGASTGDGWAAASVQLFTTSSEDNSGTSGLRGINQSALVNYAANDVRTASSGPLNVAGTNQAFIGVALGGAVSNTISISELSQAYKVFQRPKTGSTRAITVSGSTTGNPSGGIQWRLVDASTGAAISGYDWTTLIASPAAGAYNQSVNVPVNTSLVKYKIQVRFTADTTVTAELINPFSIGLVYVQYGQSNGLRRVTRTSSTLTANSFAGYFNGANWAAFTDGDGAISTVNNLIATLGIPVGYQNYSVDSQSIADLTSGTHWNALVNGTTAATGGDFEVIGIDQGERDGQLGTSSATYQSTHQTLLNNIMTHTGRDASQLTMIVNYGGNSNGYAGGYTSATIEAVRAGKAAFVAANSNAIWGGHRLDLPLSDNIHNTAGGYATASAREMQCYLHYKGLVAQPANGKTISSVNVSGSDVIVNYSGLSADLTKTGAGASTITQISTDNFSSTLSITATAVSASSVTHTLSAPPSGAVKVRDWYGADIPFTTYQGLVFPSSGESSSLSSYELTPQSGIYSLTGVAVQTLKSSLIAPASGSYALSGQSVELLKNSAMLPVAGGYLITGQSVELQYSQQAVNYTITPEPGGYTLTGQQVTLAAVRLMTPQAGTYAVTGSSVNLLALRSITPQSGSYNISGAEVETLRDFLIGAETGSYNLTGHAVALSYSGFVRKPIYSISVNYAVNTATIAYKTNNVLLYYKPVED